VLAELRQPAKSVVWLQRAHRFWLTVPDRALLGGVTVPDRWGVLVLPAGGAPVVVRHPAPLTPVVPFRRDVVDYVHRTFAASRSPQREQHRAARRMLVAARLPGHGDVRT
jgi:hypothetical protein